MPGMILIIDDDALNREVMEALLSVEGFTVYTAHNGESGLQLADDTHPDLILLDIKMPDMDGFTVCERLRAHPELRTTPVIFLSGYDSVEDREHAIAVGADDFLSRPFESDDLLVRIEQLLSQT